jgi:L-asparaginase/beta-aspartyl-peptidase (threonine type)
MIKYGIVVHGGAGSLKSYSDGCQKACESGFRMLKVGKSSLDAVVEAVRILENDKRFNAGYGSALRIDGKTVEMDAALMDSGGSIGIVINIRDVKNPILLARAVLGTPHVALAGRGTEEFARQAGFKPFSRISAESRKRYNSLIKAIKDASPETSGGETRRFWEKYRPNDTVGAVAVDKDGVFAAATSTGGAVPMIVGRVGDAPMPGCGFHCGEHGAVAFTGLGEEIIRKMSSRFVYDLLANGADVEDACRSALELFPDVLRTGVIAISKEGHAVLSNKGMASHAIIKHAG